MHYFGGKALIAKKIVAVLNKLRKPGQVYLEPFIGGGSVFCLMDNPKIGSDIHPELIEYWEAIRDGWLPPDEVSVEKYYEAKKNLVTGPERAFIGYGCSYGGKWFDGYARSGGRNYAKDAKNSSLRKRKGFIGSKLLIRSFFDWDVEGYLIYCDPPYEGKRKPGTRSKFNNELFWDHARHLSQNNTVVISELSAPDDFTLIWEKEITSSMHQENKKRTEKLYTPVVSSVGHEIR